MTAFDGVATFRIHDNVPFLNHALNVLNENIGVLFHANATLREILGLHSQAEQRPATIWSCFA
jgi:hypothetical protein